ncbi:Hypothetical predicted protein [Lynx pardinus]|uniref:Uncharacterized protein n=1 Tax=Lynx pardinus TaxID=191816 RepID=A0A485P5G6_LYNPA|nr:Hypothetical predicted protein [Lynx pardinus]
MDQPLPSSPPGPRQEGKVGVPPLPAGAHGPAAERTPLPPQGRLKLTSNVASRPAGPSPEGSQSTHCVPISTGNKKQEGSRPPEDRSPRGTPGHVGIP